MATFIGDGGANILTGTNKNDTLNGLGGDDQLIGSAGNDTLDGGTGNDLLIGGAGSDTYLFGSGYGNDVIDNSGGAAGDLDSIRLLNLNAADIRLQRIGQNLVLTILATGETLTVSQHFLNADFAIDRIQFADGSRWTSSTILANLYSPPVTPTEGADTINGGPTDDVLQGLGGNDILFGNGGNDSLDGGSGADRMEGGLGNDSYVVDDAGDVVIEASGAGNDTVQASISYSLGAEIERLTLLGSADLNGTGNTLANTLIGNSGNNLLDGGSGNDLLQGGDGNDSLMGSSGTDTLQGGAGNDLLDGGANSDSMAGGSGDDIYVVAQAGDTVKEAVGEGNDTVRAAVSYSLGANLENLELTGTGNFNGTGSAEVNRLTGNAGINVLNGAGGNDWMAGRRGSDTYLFSAGSGNDVIDNSGGAINDVDTLQLTGLNPDNLRFLRSGSDLLMQVLTSSETLTIQNFYLGTDFEIDRVRFANGTVWNTAQLKAAVSSNVNIAPTSTDDSLTTLEDTPVLLHVSDFGSYNDSEGTPLAAVRVTALPGTGSLQVFNGTTWLAVTVDQVVSRADLDADRLRYVPAADGNGSPYASIGFKVGDGTDFASSANTLSISVTAVNDAPTLTNALANQSAHEDSPFSFSVPAGTFSDVDGDSLSYSASLANGSPLPTWLSFDTTTRTFSGTPGNADVGSLDLSVTATDASGLSASADFSLNVGNSNDAPTVSGPVSLAAGTEDLAYSFSADQLLANAIDIDLGDVLSLQSVSVDPADGVLADQGGGNWTFTPAPNRNGVVNFAVMISDGITSVSTSASLDLVAVNDAPLGGVNITGAATETQTLTANNTLSDAEGVGAISYQWQLSDNGSSDWVAIAGTTGSTLVLSSSLLGKYVRVVASFTDGSGALESVASVATAPVAQLINQFDGDANNNVLDGTAFQDVIRGFGGADILNGYASSDTLDGSDGNDTLDGGDGDDTLNGGNDVDTLYGRAGIDTLDVGNGSWSVYESASGGDGNDVLIATGFGYLSLGGDDGDDLLTASGNRFGYLDGGNGNDTIDTRSMNSDYWVTLYLSGGSGSDTYRVGDGTGSLRISDAKDNSTAADTNVVEFASGIDPASLQVSRSGNDLIVTFTNGRMLTVSGQFSTGTNGFEAGVQEFRFADGTTWDRTAIYDHLPILNGTAGDDTLNGDARNEEINGLGGNDILNGNDGNDTLDGGDGDDTLNGGNDVDTLYGRAGIDTLDVGNGSWSVYESASGGDGNDVLIATGFGYLSLGGDDGDDLLTASGNRFGYLDGGNGNDTIDTRSMNSDYWVTLYLSGGSGSDTYRVGDGTGSLRISDAKDNSTAADTNVVEFASGIDPASLQVSRSGNDLIVTFANGRMLTVSGQFSTGTNGFEAGVQEFRFADGTTWDRTAIYDHLPILNGTAGDDTLSGDARNEEINGLGGNDILNGNDGNDTLDGGDGDDTLNGGNDVDTLYGRAGIDTLDVGNGSWSVYESASGGDGNDVLIATGFGYLSLGGDDGDDLLTASGNRFGYLDGGNGNDTIDTRSMNSDYWVTLYLSGGSGSDTYRVGDGTGSLRISDAKDNSTAADTNVVEFASGIDPTSLQVSRSGNDLIVTFANGRMLTVSGQFSTGTNGFEAGVQEFRFADGTVWTRNNLPGFNATAGDDVIIGLNGNDSLNALAGNDDLDGRGGNDTLTGGLGNDIFRFSTAPGASNIDFITDFTSGEDHLALNSTIFNLQGQAPGDPGVMANVTGTQTEQAGAMLLFNQSNQTLYYDADATANGNAQAVVTLAGVASLAASDVQMFA
ncbi:tandem-95 repeat protein [Metapseudomonas lalkuanensis]|uniref:Tandem-95 repeat protein n=1 Tax=Metapseudomonas lalkuanensis TaxID=2604832 RepID=A0A5J6QTP4_9GAMM|nr:calcium-binding protein [Pseudomonas lalkuanensis]QEY65005.1 tandem-95 repeat protein [Pseudomonas lalkuanensis]